MDVNDFAWGLLLLTNTAWAMYIVYLMILTETKEDTWQPVMVGGKKKQGKPAKKGKKIVREVESKELQEELKTVQKKYEKDKIKRDAVLKEHEDILEAQAEERSRLEQDVERLTAKYTDQKEAVTVLKERIAKYSQRGAIIKDRLRLNKEVIEEDGKQFEKLQLQVEDAKLQMEKAQGDSTALKKAKNEVNKKLKTSTSEVSHLNYEAKGLFFKINRLTGENDYLKREIERVTRRSRAATDRRVGKGNWGRKGGKGSKRGGGSGGKGYGRWDDEDERPSSGYGRYRPRHNEAAEEVEREYEDGPRPPSIPPPSPPADPMKPGISEILEKAMGDPVGRWIDDYEDGPAW